MYELIHDFVGSLREVGVVSGKAIFTMCMDMLDEN
jgi:fido (protein-threonine AMPylation protein)